MGIGSVSGNKGTGDANAAAKAAEERAKREAEAATRRAAEEAPRAAAAVAQRFQSAFGGTQPPPAVATAPEATSLLTEDVRDGQTNCLELADRWLKTTPLVKGADAVFLSDSRAGAEGQAGHVVIRRGDAIYDPASAKSYPSLAAYQQANPQYREAGSVKAEALKRILDAPPGSAQRTAELEKANVPPGLQRMLVADPQNGGVKPPGAVGPLKQPSVDAANQDYDRLKQAHPLGYRTQGIELLKQHAGDPDYQAQLIARMKEGGGQKSVLYHLAAGPEGLFNRGLQSGGRYSTGSDADRKVLTDAIAIARSTGRLTDADLNTLRAQSSGQWDEVATQVHAAKVDRSKGTEGAIGDVAAAKKTFDDAAEAAKKKSQEMAALVAGIDGTLTEAQQKKYIEAFRSDPANKAVYDAKDKAAKALADALAKHKDGGQLAIAAGTKPEDAQLLQASLEALSGTAHAKTAMDVAKTLIADPASPGTQAMKALPGFPAKLLQQGASALSAQILADSKEDPKGALETLKQTLLTDYKPLVEAAGGTKDLVDNFAQAAKLLDFAKEGDFAKLTAFLSTPGASVAKQIVTGGLVVFGGLAAHDAAKEGEWAKALKEAAGVNKELLPVLVSATDGLSKTTVGAKLGVDAAKVAKVTAISERLVPVLGLTASITSAGIHANELNSGEGNAGTVLALFGDSISVLGGLAEAGFPEFAPVGALISGAGALVTVAGEGLGEWLKSDALTKKRQELLVKAGVSPRTAEALGDANLDHLKNLRQDLGLNNEQTQQVLDKYPWLIRKKWTVHDLDPAARLLRDNGLTGAKAVAVLDQIAKGGQDQQRLITFVGYLSQWGKTAEQGDWKTLLESYVKETPGAKEVVELLRAQGAPV